MRNVTFSVSWEIAPFWVAFQQKTADFMVNRKILQGLELASPRKLALIRIVATVQVGTLRMLLLSIILGVTNL